MSKSSGGSRGSRSDNPKGLNIPAENSNTRMGVTFDKPEMFTTTLNSGRVIDRIGSWEGEERMIREVESLNLNVSAKDVTGTAQIMGVEKNGYTVIARRNMNEYTFTISAPNASGSTRSLDVSTNSSNAQPGGESYRMKPSEAKQFMADMLNGKVKFVNNLDRVLGARRR